jgi:uncharacterized protein
MKHTVLKKSAALLLTLLCLVAVLVFPAAAEETRVYDPSGMLTEAEASSLAARMDELSSAYGVEFYFATYVAENRYDDFYGDDYCTRVQNLNGTDAVLLVVTYEEFNRTYYYNMYTYGDANYDINQKEVNYILDDYDVYYNLKGGEIYDGAKAFFELSATAFEGRLGAPWILVILVSAVIALIIGLAVCAGVVASYKKKRASVDYPLEHFAKLELTKEKDSFVREYTTRTYVPRSSSGGGGSRHGGGGGHRGGR